MKRIWVTSVLLGLLSLSAVAAPVITPSLIIDEKGMTLYTFDPDHAGPSTCTSRSLSTPT